MNWLMKLCFLVVNNGKLWLLLVFENLRMVFLGEIVFGVLGLGFFVMCCWSCDLCCSWLFLWICWVELNCIFCGVVDDGVLKFWVVLVSGEVVWKGECFWDLLDMIGDWWVLRCWLFVVFRCWLKILLIGDMVSWLCEGDVEVMVKFGLYSLLL